MPTYNGTWPREQPRDDPDTLGQTDEQSKTPITRHVFTTPLGEPKPICAKRMSPLAVSKLREL